MTANEFVYECEKRTINPGIAIENPEIKQALKDRQDKTVTDLLDTI